jgi:hypothetical protein
MQIVYDFVCVVASSENIFCKSHHNVSSTDRRRYSCGVHVERNTKTVPRKPQHRSWRISQDSTGNFRWEDRCRFRLQPCGLFQARGQHWPRWNCRKTALLRLCDLKISMWKTNEKQILKSKILKLATKSINFEFIIIYYKIYCSTEELATCLVCETDEFGGLLDDVPDCNDLVTQNFAILIKIWRFCSFQTVFWSKYFNDIVVQNFKFWKSRSEHPCFRFSIACRNP